jgi:prepilin-type N-terminal cleavage/methylation domain-containing protein
MLRDVYKENTMKHAFTLIELLVVIAIIGILSLSVFTILESARVDARKAQSLQNASNLERAATYCEEYLNRGESKDCSSLSTGQCNASLITNSYNPSAGSSEVAETYAADCAFRPTPSTGFCEADGGRRATWNEAFNFCRDNGGRLCTKEEAPITDGAGCHHNGKENWTTSSCTTDTGERGVWLSTGNAANFLTCEPNLTEQAAYISCCSENE